MGEKKKGSSRIGKAILAAVNILLILMAVLFTIWYSEKEKGYQEDLMRENFCVTVDTMKQISERYLSGELEAAADWAAYIEQEHMTMDEALDYIRSVSTQSKCEAHFVDMENFRAWSTKVVDGDNTVSIYQNYFQSSDPRVIEYTTRMRKMFAGEKWVLGKYRINESQQNVISVGQAVVLRQANGTDKEYLLLRVVPVEKMKENWIFPVSYQSAEVGLIGENGDYVVPSKSMRAENFVEFVRQYNFADNYYGADHLLEQLKKQENGLMDLVDSKNRQCYWYYSRLEEFNGLDILGYIPVSALSAKAEGISIVIAVSGILLLLAAIDGAYILTINRKLRITAEIAEKASSAKTQFLSSMSHDIRTPLNAVLGMTDLAQRHIGDMNYVQECLRKISISGNHLLTLINDILEISRVESGRIGLNPVPFDIREMVSTLEGITRSQAVGHGLELEVQLNDHPAPYLVGDKLRLTQVYLNLLNNAVKYTNPGGSIRFEIGEENLQDGGIMLVCTVADTGIGMSEEFQKTMYDSFTRVADSRIDKIQGTGLGLAIVKRMVDLMNGTITCESAEGSGTTFNVRIPLTAASVSTIAELTKPDDTQELGGDLAHIRILVAEDNDLNWEIISEMLSAYGIGCKRAENGRECVDMLNEAQPGSYDLVFMDIQMPILNGRDAAREIRRSSRLDLQTIPIVAMTADAFAEDVQMCIDAGMNAHVSKPIEIDKVLSTIRVLLFRKSSEDEYMKNKRNEEQS